MTKRQTSTPRAGKADISIEKFVQAYLSNGQNAKAAYLAAHPHVKGSTAEVEGSKLLRKPKVIARLTEIQNKSVARTEITLELLINDAYGVFKEAREDTQFAAAIAAIKEVGVLTGLRVEKQDNKNVNYEVPAPTINLSGRPESAPASEAVAGIRERRH